MSKWNKYYDRANWHPLANLFPLMNEEDLDALAADIEQHGLRDKIVLYEGKVLDGRNRLVAMGHNVRLDADFFVDWKSVRLDGMDWEDMERPTPFQWVISKNLQRRHLNASQKAAVAVDIEAQFAEEAKKRQGTRTDLKAILPEGSFGQARDQAAKIVGVSARYISDAKQIKERDSTIFEKLRGGQLTLQDAKKLAALDEPARTTAIKALSEPDSDLRSAIRAAKKGEYTARVEAANPKPLEGTYRIIYADPPWKYLGLNQADEYGHAERHYNCLTDEELCNYRVGGTRSVKEMADENAVLFLWVTSPMLIRCAKIIEAWGFEYKSSFVWDKVKHNMGHYNSVRHELLLVCTKGSCKPDVPKLVDSVQAIERSDKHSQKPEQFYQIIEGMYDHGRKLELFARSARPGWDTDGNESPENPDSNLSPILDQSRNPLPVLPVIDACESAHQSLEDVEQWAEETLAKPQLLAVGDFFLHEGQLQQVLRFYPRRYRCTTQNWNSALKRWDRYCGSEPHLRDISPLPKETVAADYPDALAALETAAREDTEIDKQVEALLLIRKRPQGQNRKKRRRNSGESG